VRTLRAASSPKTPARWRTRCGPTATSAINNFYTATVYEKGAEVVRMMHTLVGREGFARGMALYFQRHDGQAVTCDDFAQAIADANPGSALATPGRLQALVRAGRHAAPAGPRPVLRRRRRTLHADAEPAQRALAGPAREAALRDPGGPGPAGRATARRCRCSWRASRATDTLLVLTEAEQTWTFVGIDARRCPRCCAASRPRCCWTTAWTTRLLVLLAARHDAFNRWEAGQRLALGRLLAHCGKTARRRCWTTPS
jgi:aminopeptidase N